MLRILFLILFCLTCFSLAAQKRTEFRVALPIHVYANGSSGFYISEVVANPQIGKMIGSAQVGIKNRRVEAVLAESIPDGFLRLSRMLAPPNKNNQQLKLIVDKLRVDEITTRSSETGTANISAQFVRVDEEGNDILLYSGSATATKKGLGDVSNKLGLLISMALSDLFQDFSESDWKTHLTSGIKIQIADTSLTSESPFHISSIKEGVYRNPSEFIARTPSDRLFEIIDRQSLDGQGYRIRYTDKIKAEPIFAVYKDDALYLSANSVSGGQANKRELIKTFFDGPYIYCEALMSDPGTAIAFGLVGAAVSNQRYGIVLDLRSGNTTLLNEKTLTRLTEDHTDLREHIYKNRKLNPIGSKKIIKELNARLSE